MTNQNDEWDTNSLDYTDKQNARIMYALGWHYSPINNGWLMSIRVNHISERQPLFKKLIIRFDHKTNRELLLEMNKTMTEFIQFATIQKWYSFVSKYMDMDYVPYPDEENFFISMAISLIKAKKIKKLKKHNI